MKTSSLSQPHGLSSVTWLPFLQLSGPPRSCFYKQTTEGSRGPGPSHEAPHPLLTPRCRPLMGNLVESSPWLMTNQSEEVPWENNLHGSMDDSFILRWRKARVLTDRCSRKLSSQR